jgi:hypothetical protein
MNQATSQEAESARKVPALSTSAQDVSITAWGPIKNSNEEWIY